MAARGLHPRGGSMAHFRTSVLNPSNREKVQGKLKDKLKKAKERKNRMVGFEEHVKKLRYITKIHSKQSRTNVS